MKSDFGVKTLCRLVVAITVLLFSAVSGWAHKVNVFAYVEGDTVVVEGYFSGNAKAQDSPVEVFDSDGKKILEGKTDGKGMYSFKLADLPPIKGDMRIVLDAGMGHRADFTLSAPDMPVPSQQRQSAQLKSEEKVTGELPSVANPSIQAQDRSELKKVLEESLDRKIQPLINMLGNQQKMLMEQKDKGPTIAEIVGGLGWILGIAGVAGYFMGRKRKPGNGP
ncbi:MAG: hypothetical protein ACLP5H_30525 [Desulfomonilaceae bacterium]